jgi:hypothetical protein
MIPSHRANLDGMEFSGTTSAGSSLGVYVGSRFTVGAHRSSVADGKTLSVCLLESPRVHQIAPLEATKHLDVPVPDAIVWPAKVGKAVTVERALGQYRCLGGGYAYVLNHGIPSSMGSATR